jgi:signal peptidase II
MLPYLLIILAFVADRVTKWWAAENLVEFRPIVVNEFLTFQSTYNRGVAFGMFQGIGPVVGWLSILIVLGLLIHMMRTPRRFWLLRLGLAMIIGGAMGNLIDRIAAGEVLDFIRVSFLPGIFNVSDVMVNVGMLVSLAAVFLQPENEVEEIEALEMDEVVVEQETAEPGSALGEEAGIWGVVSGSVAGQEGDDEQQQADDPGSDPQAGFAVDVEQGS